LYENEEGKMTLNKGKLLLALKQRRKRIIDNNKKRKLEYPKNVEKYRREVIAAIEALKVEIKFARKEKDIARLMHSGVITPDPPRKPHNKPPLAALDKAILELELCEETTLSVESSRNFLTILRGDEDGQEREFDDEDSSDDFDQSGR
jgi:hypothetical protein